MFEEHLLGDKLRAGPAEATDFVNTEALRAPGERGIAQYRYTWDGHALVGDGSRCPTGWPILRCAR